MIGVVLRVLAFILFVIAGVNQVLLGQPAIDLIAFGLAAWVLATLLGGVSLGRFDHS